jgi:hypothetical protein
LTFVHEVEWAPAPRDLDLGGSGSVGETDGTPVLFLAKVAEMEDGILRVI